MNNSVILITGGLGFVGSNLAIKFKEKYPKSQIIVFDNLKRRGSELNISRLKRNNVKFFHGDVRNKEDFESIGNFDYLIDCSAEPSVLAGYDKSPQYVINTNLFGTINCLEEVRKRKAKIIFLSTSRVYSINALCQLKLETNETRFFLIQNQKVEGVSRLGINEKFPVDKYRSFYGATKLASELFVQEYIQAYGLSGIINRCGVIAGPWQMGKIDQGVISLWVKHHLWGESLAYIGFNGTGKQVRDILHVDDLFDLLVKQMKNDDKLNGDVYNIGGGIGNSISLVELTQVCEQIVERNIQIKSEVETRIADIPYYVTDNTKVSTTFNWQPQKKVKDIVFDIKNWLMKEEKLVKKILMEE